MAWWVVCYDITSDRKRTRLAKVLGAYGERVQDSVFEVRTRDAGELAELRGRLAEAAGEEDAANVRFYPLCENCRGKAARLDGEPIMRVPLAIIV